MDAIFELTIETTPTGAIVASTSGLSGTGSRIEIDVGAAGSLSIPVEYEEGKSTTKSGTGGYCIIV